MPNRKDDAAIDDRMRCGIVLHPAGHTRSPAMHTAAYRSLALPARYDAFDVPPDDLTGAIEEFRRLELRQFAVSIPHKETIIEWIDEIDEIAAIIGAVNTVTRIEDRLVGTNTDWIGAVRALERETTLAGKRAVVLGAGGTARALTYGLRARGAEVHVLNRTVARAEALATDLDAESAGPLEKLAELAPDLVVNTTSVGLREDRSPVPAAALPEGAVVMDAVYDPERTRLLADAAARGGKPIGGKWMLVYQAIEQLRLWTALLEDPPSSAALDAVSETMASAFDRAGQ